MNPSSFPWHNPVNRRAFAKKANWLAYYKTGQIMLTIPAMSLQQLVQHLKSSLGIAHVRIIGNPEQSCSRIALLPGAWGRYGS